MKKLHVAIVIVIVFAASAYSQSETVSPADLKQLTGVWSGNLTYLDYGSNKRTSIKSDLKVSITETDSRSWTFEYIYPDEPKANGNSVVKLSADGRTFNEQAVAGKEKLADGTLKIVTTKEGTDNNKKALFRYTYLIGPSRLSILKEVKVEGSEAYFERNTYTWTR